MAGSRRFTTEEIQKMLELKRQGYSNRKIALLFNAPKTTVWINVFREKEQAPPPYRNLQLVVQVIKQKKETGKNTLQVAQELDIPLAEVNYIWGEILVKGKM